MPVLATFGDYEGLVDALRSRRITLGMSQIALEDRAGLTGGYVGKIEGRPGKPNSRAIGRESLPLLLGALNLELAVVEKEARTLRVSKITRRGKLLIGEEAKKFMTKRGRKGARKVNAMKTKEQRRAAARHAVKARWEKHRASQKRQSRGKAEPIIVSNIAYEDGSRDLK
ncbi:MAG TPA: hypothetical protein VEZ16_00205 [Microvirga sp.]|nr:hypothetical protein [Microvirga sp.]